MNNRTYFIRVFTLLIVLVGILFNSCEDYFDTEIGGRISPDEHYQSKIEADASYNGCFGQLQSIAQYMVMLDGLRSDQMSVTENADADMRQIYRHEFTMGNKYFDPSNFYKVIMNVNEVLPKLPPIVESDRYFDSVDLAAYTSALVTLRGWAYFNLTRLTGKMGLLDTGSESSVTYYEKDEALDYLIEELTPYVDREDRNRSSLELFPLLGEIYLEKGNYDSAAYYLKLTCDGDYNSQTDGGSRRLIITGMNSRSNWSELFINSDELWRNNISAVPYTFEQNQPNNLEAWMVDYYMVKPSQKLLDSFNNDESKSGKKGDLYRGYGNTFDTLTADIPYINKYAIVKNVPYSADIFLYRAADVHLMLAEALNRMGQVDIALALVNRGIKSMDYTPEGYRSWTRNIGVRGRVDLAPIEAATTTEEVEDLIIEERAKELAFEGKRWFDLVRIAERRGNPNYLADKVAAKFTDANEKEAIKQKLLSPSNWYLSIGN